MDAAPIPARENDSSCLERRHSTVDRAAKALGLRRSGKLRRRAFEMRHQSGHRIVRARSREAGKSSAEIAGNAEIRARSAGAPAAGRRNASAESRRATELHLWVAWRPLIGEAAANPAAGNAQIPACRAGVPAAAGRRNASAESRRATELHLWVAWRPLIGEAAANPAAGIAQISACRAGVPAAAGRRHASAESRRVTELHLWVAWRPLIGEAAANPAAGIAQIPRGT
jgi:hypothetical protein